MDNLKKFISEIREFDFNDLKSESKTQASSDLTENYVESAIKNNFGKNIMLIKAASQQYPDFILISNQTYTEMPEDTQKLIKTKVAKGTSPLLVVKKWVEDNNYHDKVVFIEVKSGKGKLYQCNDSLPNPTHPYLYIMFDKSEEIVHISTSLAMAEREMERSGFDIKAKYLEDKKQVELWRGEKKEEWSKIGINSTPRMTYSITTKYAHAKVSDEEIEKIFKKANL